MDIENIDLFPFVLSLSKHERGFAGQAPYPGGITEDSGRHDGHQPSVSAYQP